MEAVKEFVDLGRTCRRAVLQHIFLDRRLQSRRQKSGIESARIRCPGQEALGPGENQSVNLLLIFAQTDSQQFVGQPYAITIFQPRFDHLSPMQFDEAPGLWLPVLVVQRANFNRAIQAGSKTEGGTLNQNRQSQG